MMVSYDIFILLGLMSVLFGVLLRLVKLAFVVNMTLILEVTFSLVLSNDWPVVLLFITSPLLLINTALYVFILPMERGDQRDKTYRATFRVNGGKLNLNNIKRGVSIIGSAGSGKTESVVYQLLRHFKKNNFCGIIHDYKDFELTEIAFALFKTQNVPLKVVSFDRIIDRVNPIAPRYLKDEESVNEVARVLLDNLLEHEEGRVGGTTRFFQDAAEGLIGGLIWKMKTDYPDYCTLPHVIALFHYLDIESLTYFLKSNLKARAMANTFISGQASERQTAGVMSTLANALKKISTERIFMALSADEVPLMINNSESPGIVTVVNNPQYENSYTPVIATVIHTLLKQMSVRNALPSFLLMEEAPTIRLSRMHRIPATLRSYGIVTVYVMQDKVQNDMVYGDKASRAILSNLSYQFFGKVNDPDTAKYYERFFQIVKDPTKSVSRGHNLSFDTRVTTGERETPKVKANEFFRLKQGEFITYADGKDKKVQFKPPRIKRESLQCIERFSKRELEENFERIYKEVAAIFE